MDELAREILDLQLLLDSIQRGQPSTLTAKEVAEKLKELYLSQDKYYNLDDLKKIIYG